MGKPRAMSSVIFGDLFVEPQEPHPDESDPAPPATPPDTSWISDSPVFALDLVDFWRIRAHRIRTASYRPEDSDFTSLEDWMTDKNTSNEGGNFRLEARTTVGASFSGFTADYVNHLKFDPHTLDPPIVQVPVDLDTGLPILGDWLPGRVVALEVGAAAVPASRMNRRELLGSLGAMAVAAACQGPENPVRATPESVCGPTSGRTFVPTQTSELPRALGLTETHAAGNTGEGVVVTVVDSGVEIDTRAPPRWFDSRVATGDLDATTDERGHGTAVIQHLVAVAPGVKVRSVKYVDNSGHRNYPVAAFQRAVSPNPLEPETDAPDIIVCSWVMVDLSVALQREIAEAVRRGIVVIFAAGNKQSEERKMTDQPPSRGGVVYDYRQADGRVFETRRWTKPQAAHVVSHPDAISVGGLQCRGVGNSGDEGVATYFDSELYDADNTLHRPPRHVPDLCGLVAATPHVGDQPKHVKSKTSVDSTLDRKPDGTAVNDGEVWTSGTSMAAAHVAGVAALLLNAHPGLSPRAVRNVLLSSTEHRWTERTGHGLVHGATTESGLVGALSWLQSTATPALRRSYWPSVVPTALSDFRCPDLVIRMEGRYPRSNQRLAFGDAMLQREIDDVVVSGQRHRIFMRVSNRSTVSLPTQDIVLYKVESSGGRLVLTRLTDSLSSGSLAMGDYRVVASGASVDFALSGATLLGAVGSAAMGAVDALGGEVAGVADLVRLVDAQVGIGIRYIGGVVS